MILKPTTTDTELEVTKVRQAMVNQAIARIKQIYLPEDLRRRVLYDDRTPKLLTQRPASSSRRSARSSPNQPLPIEQRQLSKKRTGWLFQEERGYLAMVTREVPPGDDPALYREIIMAKMVIFSGNDD